MKPPGHAGWKRGTGQRVKLSNRFEALQDEENDVEWIQWCAEKKEGKHLGKREIVVRMEHYGEKKVCCEFDGLSTP